MNLHRNETRRHEAQAEIDRKQGPRHRNETGQFATPLPLARSIARVARKYLADGRIRFLEPAIGTGAFFSALLHEGIRPASALGFELNPELANVARDLWSEAELDVRVGDFTKEPPDYKANLILTNPPYVRHHHLSQSNKGYLKKAVANLAPDLNGLAGLYTYFLVLAERWMDDNGIAAWLLPSEWMDVGYGEAIRRYLTTRVTIKRLHVFDASVVQFGDALVSSSVLILQKRRPSASDLVLLTAGDLDHPVHSRRATIQELRAERRWSRLAADGLSTSSPTRTVGDLIAVRRGVATGANSFFIRPRSEFEKLGVPESFLRPILPSSRRLKTDVVEADSRGYPMLDEPPALLDCRMPWEQVTQQFPGLARLLASDEGKRASRTYLASRRRPWYSQEWRPAPDLVCTYMGRGRDNGCPFRVILNRSNAIATNTYLLLYAEGALRDAFNAIPDSTEQFASLLRETIRDYYLRHSRVYGGGLYKLEPAELCSLPADRIWDAMRLDRFDELVLL